MILLCASSAWCAITSLKKDETIHTIDMEALSQSLRELSKMPQEVNDIIDVLREFILGVWDGINETFQYDLRYIRWCFKAPGRLINVWAKLKDIIEKFMKTFDFFQPYDSIKELSLQTLVHGLPCYMMYNFVEHFLDLFDIEDFDDLKDRVMMTVLSNLQLFLNDVMEIFSCLQAGDFRCVGYDIGQIIYVLIFH